MPGSLLESMGGSVLESAEADIYLEILKTREVAA
jgi:hypothetical protein